MIDPFMPEQVRGDAISYGLSSFGYDIRIAGDFRIFTPNAWNSVVDPKKIDERSMLYYETCDHILIPPTSYALGRSVDKKEASAALAILAGHQIQELVPTGNMHGTAQL